MKKFVLAAVAASMLTVPAMASAAPQQRTVIVERGPGYTQRTVVRDNRNNRRVVQNNRQAIKQQRQQARRWAKGQRFDRRYATNYRQIDYRSYRQRGLYAPPRGQQWVQSGNDAVLVALASGLIGAVIGGAIN